MTEPQFLMKGPHRSFLVRDVVALKPNHARVLALRERGLEPREFGSRIWRSSYLLIDYLSRLQFARGDHLMELGCGWGLPSLYLHKHHDVRVTATDGDACVREYQQLLSEVNAAEVPFLQRRFSELQGPDLEGVTALVGADICYSPQRGDELLALFERFLGRSGGQVILADSGRDSFFELARRLEGRWPQRLLPLSLQRPALVQGHILHIGTA
jgi:predicted nicotinamide N-methyase